MRSRDATIGALDTHMRQIVELALAAGCTLERRKKHLALRLPDGSLQTISSSRHGRSDRNLRAQLRRRGVDI